MGVDHPVQSGAELLQALDPFGDLGLLRAQRAGHVRGRVVQDGPDRVQTEADLPVDDDTVQAFQVTGGVEAVSRPISSQWCSARTVTPSRAET
jgi:hypothetical protein